MSYDSMYGGYSTHPLPTRNSDSAERNIPKYVKELAEKIEKEDDKEPDYAFPVAWSVYCKYIFFKIIFICLISYCNTTGFIPIIDIS